MASPITVEILEICKVSPATDSNESGQRVSLPLTFLDTRLLKFPQAERLYLYKHINLTPTLFMSTLLPRLKRALSLTLLHFLPLAGHLTWPSDSPEPVILYDPNDAVSLTVAESNAEFDLLVSNGIREVAELRPYIPLLSMSDTEVSIISLRITLFPSKGFSVGIAMHHAALDGKSGSMFLKAWAYTCKQNQNDGKPSPLLPELIPSFDRSCIGDPDGLNSYYLNYWLTTTGSNSNSKTKTCSLKLLQNVTDFEFPPNLVRATFQLSPDYISKIRESVQNYYDFQNQPVKLHMSTFVIVSAYASVCLVKARGGSGGGGRMVYFLVAVDCRSRLDPPVPENYMGNCVFTVDMVAEAADFMEENGVAVIAKRISDLVKGLEKGVFEGARERHVRLRNAGEQVQKIAVVGSPRFCYYEEDFGWGKPEKVEITSVDRINGIQLKDSRDGNGVIEIGLVLPRHEMEAFSLLFDPCLNGLSR
ncbi:phenolic glucoside malonyltransferase 1-like [Euphorbia lathyris]|uniref:phenolic glucoside malonyltransferase 1-like n=1 Tax=Euphorbia lathyris TaxID=212925 RepID=UPI003314222E